MKRLLLFIPFIISLQTFAQSTYAPLDQDYYHLIDRYEIKRGAMAESFFSAWKPYNRKAIATFADTLEMNGRVDQFNKAYLLNDNWEWADSVDYRSSAPIFRKFYRSKTDLYHVKTKSFDMHLNPVIQVALGNETASDQMPYINTRGVEIRGVIDEKVGFYSFITDNQMVQPLYVRQRNTDTEKLYVPHEGFWKGFKEGAGVDFFTARGYISVQATKHIDVQFGHDRFKIGNGYRSLLLSDFGPAYLFLKFSTQVWRFKYTNLFTQMTADYTGSPSGLSGSGAYPKKYMTLHHLSINLGKKVNVGLFESIIFSRPDSIGNHYQLQYLNPVIFYRSIEQQNGSPDNALIGMDFKWLVARKFSIYGQLVLDEFVLDNLREGNGWWANKYGIQLGGEYIDAFGISNLDVQGELNWVRPYTYSHNNAANSYSQYHQPLAHPLGANFREIVGILRYQPMPRLNLTAKLVLADYGVDGPDENWGGDILKINTTREQDLNNEIAQGIRQNLFYSDMTASYQLKYNLFIDLKHTYRKLESEDNSLSTSNNYTAIAVRLNIPQRLNDF